MTIKAKLDAAWTDNMMQDATFEFRALLQNFYFQVSETQSKMIEILAKPVFANVDAEIKTEGIALRNIVNSLKTTLDTHLEFINWTQP